MVNIDENVTRMYVNQSQDYFPFRPKEITDTLLFPLTAAKVLSKPYQVPRKLPSEIAVVTQAFVAIVIHLQFRLFSVKPIKSC